MSVNKAVEATDVRCTKLYIRASGQIDVSRLTGNDRAGVNTRAADVSLSGARGAVDRVQWVL